MQSNWKWTDVSEERVASFLKAEVSAKQEINKKPARKSSVRQYIQALNLIFQHFSEQTSHIHIKH
jgi:hypothetical protein